LGGCFPAITEKLLRLEENFLSLFATNNTLGEMGNLREKRGKIELGFQQRALCLESVKNHRAFTWSFQTKFQEFQSSR
jgi:hypothetical protein